jgi:deoxyribodipyrimidine photo-lyase
MKITQPLKGPLQVVWFKRDLRLSDHAPLVNALALGPVLLLHVVEPPYWRQPDVSARQFEFMMECVTTLQDDVTARGGALTLREGNVVDILSSLHGETEIASLWSHEETGNSWTFERDKQVAAWCRENRINWHELPQMGVTRGLRNRDEWARWHGLFMAKASFLAPTSLHGTVQAEPVASLSQNLGNNDVPCPLRQRGGRNLAMRELDSFFARRGRKYTFEMSSPLTAAESCSRLSPYLAMGCLSIREVMHRALAEREKLANTPIEDRTIELRSCDSFISRLHWHCHFIQKLESEPEIEWRSMHPAFEAARHRHAGHDAWLDAYETGQTGYPFVDACMRSLRATGWINFRMRAMLAAFACYHLELDWHDVGHVLARLFTDYEPGIHWPQMQMQAGQTGINTPRIYNPVKQSMDQDPDGVFIRRWVPEVAVLPTAFLHEPWKLAQAEQQMFGVSLGITYPNRLVDHVEAMRSARERLTLIRRGAGFRATSEKVYQRHGSRKRTLRDDNPDKTRAINARKAKSLKTQLTLDL